MRADAGGNLIGGFVGYHSGLDAACSYNAEKNPGWGAGYAYAGTGSDFSVSALTIAETEESLRLLFDYHGLTPDF